MNKSRCYYISGDFGRCPTAPYHMRIGGGICPAKSRSPGCNTDTQLLISCTSGFLTYKILTNFEILLLFVHVFFLLNFDLWPREQTGVPLVCLMCLAVLGRRWYKGWRRFGHEKVITIFVAHEWSFKHQQVVRVAGMTAADGMLQALGTGPVAQRGVAKWRLALNLYFQTFVTYDISVVSANVVAYSYLMLLMLLLPF